LIALVRRLAGLLRNGGYPGPEDGHDRDRAGLPQKEADRETARLFRRPRVEIDASATVADVGVGGAIEVDPPLLRTWEVGIVQIGRRQ